MQELPSSNRYHAQYTQEFVKRWDDLIDWQGRAAGEAGFFARLLSAHGVRTVADVACGTGFHAVVLAQAGFEVVASDGSANMIERTRANAKRHGVQLAGLEVADWRNLHTVFGENRFDAVLCLGNAFTHLFEHEARRDALEAMLTILRPGGMLVIDHRNYDRILGEGFSSKHRYYYTGENVDARPSQISRTLCRFEYAFEDGRRFDLDLYPLKQGYLAHLLEDAGFVEITRYGDFERPFDEGDVDFIQQVAFKPRRAGVTPTENGSAERRAEVVRQTQAYYDGAADEIYRDIWGENLHIGIFERPDESLQTAMARSNERISSACNIDAQSRILDVGCGYGAAARYLAERFGCRVTATNISARELERARELTAAARLDHRVDFQWADFHELPFLPDSFDIYWSQEAFLHAFDKQAVLQEAHRVLRPGGRLVFTDLVVRRGTPEADRERIYARVNAPEMWDVPDYADALRRLGFRIEIEEDLSQHVAPTYAWVRRELERRRPEFEARIGKDVVDRTSTALQFWVDAANAGKIGWAWFVARK